MSATYSAKDVSLIVGGTIIEGFEQVVINTNMRWDYDHDNQGNAIRFEQANYKYVTVNIDMKQTSKAQEILTIIYREGSQVPLIIRDGNGTDLFAAAKMSLEAPSSITRAKSALNDNTWELKGNYTELNIGGND